MFFKLFCAIYYYLKIFANLVKVNWHFKVLLPNGDVVDMFTMTEDGNTVKGATCVKLHENST